jgi:hypothetical protein
MDKRLINYDNEYNFEITDSLSNKKYVKEIIDKLETIEHYNLNLYILESEIIPEILLKKIFELNNYKNLEVHTISSNLYSYLYSLSIKVKFLKDRYSSVKEKIIEEQINNHIQALLIMGSIESIDYIIYLLSRFKNLKYQYL